MKSAEVIRANGRGAREEMHTGTTSQVGYLDTSTV